MQLAEKPQQINMPLCSCVLGQTDISLLQNGCFLVVLYRLAYLNLLHINLFFFNIPILVKVMSKTLDFFFFFLKLSPE